MSVRILYFAWVREKLGQAEESVTLPNGISTVSDLLAWQSKRSPIHEEVFERTGVVRVAVDQIHVERDASIVGAREIAFFPPVTGG